MVQQAPLYVCSHTKNFWSVYEARCCDLPLLSRTWLSVHRDYGKGRGTRKKVLAGCYWTIFPVSKLELFSHNLLNFQFVPSTIMRSCRCSLKVSKSSQLSVCNVHSCLQAHHPSLRHIAVLQYTPSSSHIYDVRYALLPVARTPTQKIHTVYQRFHIFKA